MSSVPKHAVFVSAGGISAAPFREERVKRLLVLLLLGYSGILGTRKAVYSSSACLVSPAHCLGRQKESGRCAASISEDAMGAQQCPWHILRRCYVQRRNVSFAAGCQPRLLLLPSPHHTVRVHAPVPEEVRPQHGQVHIPKSSLCSG